MMLLMLLKLGAELGKEVAGADKRSWLRPPRACWLLYEGIGFPAGDEPELPEEGEARTAEPESSGINDQR